MERNLKLNASSAELIRNEVLNVSAARASLDKSIAGIAAGMGIDPKIYGLDFDTMTWVTHASMKPQGKK